MLRSMTAYATGSGTQDTVSWTWELRGVNGKGLDLRLRVPEGIPGLEAALRTRLAGALGRGNVSLSLRLSHDADGGGMALAPRVLEDALTALSEIETRAIARGITLAPATAADLLAQRGVFAPRAGEEDGAGLADALLADFETVLAAFTDMRAAEGAALARVLTSRLDEIGEMTEAAAAAAQARQPEIERAFNSALARVLENAGTAGDDRIAQELALLAVKADVTEEIDRLRAHVAAARDLLAAGSPVGRRLDFLMQEFNREANTLCSKAQNTGLTAAGLDLKTAIDQMREQVQNVE